MYIQYAILYQTRTEYARLLLLGTLISQSHLFLELVILLNVGYAVNIALIIGMIYLYRNTATAYGNKFAIGMSSLISNVEQDTNAETYLAEIDLGFLYIYIYI